MPRFKFELLLCFTEALKPSEAPPPQKPTDNRFAIARPHATEFLIRRQTSFRGFSTLQVQD